MSTRGTTFAKRQREMDQKDRSKDKDARRDQRRERKKTGTGGAEIASSNPAFPDGQRE